MPHPLPNWHELVRNLVPRLVPNLVMDLVPDLVPDQMPNLILGNLGVPDLVSQIWYQICPRYLVPDLVPISFAIHAEVRNRFDTKSGNRPGTESDLAPDLGHHW